MDIISRADWGARSPKNPPRAILTPTPELWLHHTASSDGEAARVRAIQRYHQDVKGWNDIAYSYLISGSGTIYEGRGAGVRGAHTAGHNGVSHAVCVLGNYNLTHPTPVSILTVAELLKHGHGEGWWPDQFTGGHRDVGSTSCPGNNLYPLIPEINRLGGDMFTDHEIKELKKLVAALDSVNSNGSFAAPAVKLIRKERGLPLHTPAGHEHDGRYVKNVTVAK